LAALQLYGARSELLHQWPRHGVWVATRRL